MSWLISFVLAYLSWEEREAYQMKYSYQQWDSNLQPFAYKADMLSITQ